MGHLVSHGSVAPSVLDFRHHGCCRKSGLMVVEIGFDLENAAAAAVAV